jgi:hypothetical protein
LSKNHLDAWWEYRWLYPFVMSQFLDEGLARKNTASVSAERVAGVDDFEVAEATYRASRSALASGAHHPATGHPGGA